LYPDYPDPMPAFQFIGDQGRALLESALAEPQQTYGGEFLHRTLFDKAAALFRSIILNHGLLDGNKRLSLASTTCFLLLNGYVFSASRDEAVGFAIRVAEARARPSLVEISRWIRRNSISVEKLSSLPRREKAKYLGVQAQFDNVLTRQIDELLSQVETLLSGIERRISQLKE